MRVLFEDHTVEHYNTGLTDALTELGCEVQRFKLGSGLLGFAPSGAELQRLVHMSRSYDVVHLNSAFHSDAMSVLVGLRRKFLITHHGAAMHAAMSGKERSLWAIRLRALKPLSLAGVPIVTVSNFAAASLNSQLKVRPRVIYHGVEPRWFQHTDHKSQARARFGIPEDRVVLLWVGRATQYKDPATLLRAAARLRDTNPELLFLMKLWRTGPLDQDIVSFVKRNNLSRSIQILHDIPLDSIPLLYASADAFVHTSRFEGFGLAVLEAMASGLPVVVADEGGPCEYVGEGGLTFAAGDYVSLSNVISTLSRDNEQRERLAKSCVSVARTFTWRKAAEAYLRAYKS